MQISIISVLCIALAVGLTTGIPLFYESAKVLNKVEFSDLGIDGDRIDPLIDDSEEEQQLRNITEKSATESVDATEETQNVLKVTVISTNVLPDVDATGVPSIGTTEATNVTLTTTEMITATTPESMTLVNDTSGYVIQTSETSTAEVDIATLVLATEVMPKLPTLDDIEPKEET
uniref:Uncharacterized protein n=1 Tax=Anopheles maculatus TaxID=74869 RepID=A0A182S8N8_9DIPT